ncbi:MAG: Ribosomal large subunit pseudouridine synthase D [Candidatus Anoxychlamydiales bacterium]|nr:Ribosomal large subunit pseudouridine synthase D [Candidatus Anoxychlamydiales bacterium]
MLDQNIFLITDEKEQIRIDKLLAEKFASKSRSYFQYLIENGSVLVNSKKVKKRFSPKMNDEIEIFFQALPDISLKAQNIPLDIIFEDEHILAINKPSNMVVHPASGNWDNTFVNALLYYFKDLIYEKTDIRPGIVHRLDKDTTGVLIAAKTTQAHQKLIELFKNRQMQKTYLAITLNTPKDQIINLPIARHKIKRKEMAISQGGKEAISEIKLLKNNNKLSFIEISPKTGRTHQIRVHLKHINCPILGDETYGNKSVNKHFKVDRQLLHAHSLKFNHPITQKAITITAPINENFKKFIEILS